jgi:ketosteroid isomerase-like protein
MREYDPTEQRNLRVVRQFLGEVPGPSDKAELFAPDGVWWNGLPMIPGAVGVTEHVGRDAIRNLLPSQTTSKLGKGGDRYDLTTKQVDDVVTLADGDYVVRQQTFRARTLRGRQYENTYCFVFRFNDRGEIQYLTEHWNTWHAHRVLFDNFDVTPAHPNR